MRRIISRKVEVEPDGELYVDLYQVTPGSSFTLKLIEVYFPVGTGGQLQVKILQGWIGVAPTNGYFTGDDVTIKHEVEAVYGSQATIRAHVINLDKVSKKEAVITLVGEES